MCEPSRREFNAPSASCEPFTTRLQPTVRIILCVGLAVFWFWPAFEVAQEGDHLDIQTFALLVGLLGYLVTRVLGSARARAIEQAFVWSGAAAVVAVVFRGDITEERFNFLVLAAAYAGVAWLIRPDESSATSPTPTTAELQAMLNAAEHRLQATRRESAQTTPTTAELQAMLNAAEHRLEATRRASARTTAVLAAVVASIVASIVTRIKASRRS